MNSSDFNALNVEEKIKFINEQKLFLNKNQNRQEMLDMLAWIEFCGLDFWMDNEEKIHSDSFIPIYSTNILVEKIFEKYPEHERYSRKLIEYGYLGYRPELLKLINKGVLDDKDFIMSCFKKDDFKAFVVYTYLSKRLMNDEEVCHLVEEKQYYTMVLNSKLKNMSDFDSYVSRHGNSSYGSLNIIVDKAKSLDFVFSNSESIVEFFRIINQYEVRSELDAMSDPQVSDHCIRELLVDLGQRNDLIKMFWETDLGKQMDDFIITGYSNYTQFDYLMVKEVYPVLLQLLRFSELEKKIKAENVAEHVLRKI